MTPKPRTLGAAYERCRQLHARHGRTYYLATVLLPGWKRRHVHALYGFTRYADEIVDNLATTLDPQARAAALQAWGERLFAGLQGAPVVDPPAWEAQGLTAGTPFSLDHRFTQTAWLRPRNRSAAVPGLYFAGMGTIPGVGVPMVLVSGRLAAERVLGRERRR